MLTIGLSLIFIVVLVGPFLNKKIESNLEAFLFLMGVISATFANAWSTEVIHEGFIAPINITLAVLGAGVLFHYLRHYIDHGMRRVLITMPLSVIVCSGIIILGLVSSMISAIIAALLLVEFISVLPLHRHAEVNLNGYRLLRHRSWRGAHPPRRTALDHRRVEAERPALSRDVLLFVQPPRALRSSRGYGAGDRRHFSRSRST